MQGRKLDRFTFIFATTDPSLHCKARAEEIRQVLKASTALKSFAASDGRLCEFCHALFEQTSSSLTFLNRNKFLKIFLKKEQKPWRASFRNTFRQLKRVASLLQCYICQ